jgi:hypothetical protein
MCAGGPGLIPRPETGARPPENMGLYGSPMTGINRAYAI